MRALILARYPSHGILGEEFGTIGDPMQAEYAWVLDPIDGTKSFITGKPLFGTLIALVRYGTPVLGIVDQCVLNRGREFKLATLEVPSNEGFRE